MKTNPLLKVVLVIFIFYSPAHGQESIKFDSISIEEGLSQSLVTSILQDNKGFLWFGTADGLNKFDGYTFEIFRHDDKDPDSIDNNWVTTIFEDASGIIWVGTKEGLNRFNAANKTFTHFLPRDADSEIFQWRGIKSIAEDNQGYLWIGTFNEGIFRFDRSRTNFLQYIHSENDPGSISSNNISRITQDNSGELWILTYSNVMNRYNEEKDSFEQFSLNDENVKSVSQILDYDESTYFVGSDIGLIKIRKNTGEQETIASGLQGQNTLPSVLITDMVVDAAGNIWISTRNGLARFDIKTETISSYEYDPDDPFSLSVNNLNDLFIDRSGILWIATNGLGVSYYSTHKYKFKLYQHHLTGPYSLSDNYVYSILEDNDGNIWFGANYGGLNRMNPITRKIEPFDVRGYFTSFKDIISVHSLLQLPSGKIYVGTNRVGLLQFDPADESWRFFDIPGSVRAMKQEDDGSITLGMPGKGIGKIFFNPDGTYEFNSLADEIPMGNNRIMCLVKDNSENLWIGTEVGLYKANLALNEHRTFLFDENVRTSLSDNYVISALNDSNGDLWFGTRRGLNKYIPETDSFIRFTTEQGFPNDVIYGILEDDNNHLWLSTNKGIIQFDVNSNQVVRSYTSRDGLQSNEFNSGAYLKTQNGELYFGGIKGANSFFPDDIQINQTAPQIAITSISSFGEPLTLETSPSELENITLKYEERYISIEFAALDFSDPSRNQYKYFMNGVDPDWVDSGQRRFVNYNLFPGNYIFQVKGSNSDGIWNEEGAELRITVIAPYWDTWWFKTLLAFLITSIISALFFLRILNMRKQQNVLQSLVKSRTLELEKRSEELEETNKELESFSYMVSHDLRAPVRHIKSYSQLLLDEHIDSMDESGRKFLNRIDAVSSRMENLIEDLLWLSRASHFDLEYSSLNLSGIAAVILKNLQQRYTDRVVTLIIEPGITAQGDLRLIEVAIENLLSNAWKFTSKKDAAKIEFGSMKDAESTVCFIRDNGVGFHMAHIEKLFTPFERLHSIKDFEGTGIGLATVEKIIHRHGGRIWAEATPDEGATFFFTLPGMDK